MHTQLSLRSIAIGYAILLIASWGPVTELSGFVAALGLVTLPFLVGSALRMALTELRRRSETLELKVQSAFKSWLLGLIALSVSTSLASTLLAPEAFDAALIVSAAGLAYCIARGGAVRISTTFLTPRTLTSGGILLIGSIMPFWYLRRLAPFPFTLGSDLFVYMARIGSVLSGTSGVKLWDTSLITMVATASTLAHSEPLWVFWMAPLFQYMGFACGIYWLAKRVIQNEWLCIASALLPLWFMGDGQVNDLMFLLPRNIIMALIPFVVVVFFVRNEHDSEIKVVPIVISGVAALFYFFAVSEGVYNLFTTRLPSPLQYLFQPGFILTSPAYTFDLSSAVVQDFYAAVVSSVLFLAAVKLSGSHERRLLIWWYLVTAAGILIEYRMGMLLSAILLGLLVLRRYSSSIVPPILGVLGVGIIGTLLMGTQSVYLALQDIVSSLAYILSQGVTKNALGTSLSARIEFLVQNYGVFFLGLYLLSLFSLSILYWHDKSTRRLFYLPILALVCYFCPFPSPFYFLVLVTPFVGITICLALERSYFFVSSETRDEPKSTPPSPGLRSSRSLRMRRPAQIDPQKAVFAAVVCLIVLVSASTITEVYNSNISDYRTSYGVSHSVASFGPQDLLAADWLKSNFPPTTLLISDPASMEILSALAGLPYTVQSRVITQELQTDTIVEAETSLFNNIVTTLSPQSLNNLVGLYRTSDRYMGFNSSNLMIVLVVDNRTSWWANGLPSYAFADRFMNFSGLPLYSSTPFVRSILNVTATYRLYALTMPRRVEQPGPVVQVRYANGTQVAAQTQESYYYPLEANYTVVLTGAIQYMVQNVPIDWFLEGVNGSASQSLNYSQAVNGSSLLVRAGSVHSFITVKWVTQFPSTVEWKIVNWALSMQRGPNSTPLIGSFAYTDTNGTLTASLGSGPIGEYTSIVISGLNYSLARNTLFVAGTAGSSNALLAVAITLSSGARFFLFNATRPTWFQPPEGLGDVEESVTVGPATISSIQVFLRSSDGLPANASLQFIVAIRQP